MLTGESYCLYGTFNTKETSTVMKSQTQTIH